MSINVASYADLLVMIAKLKEENERLSEVCALANDLAARVDKLLTDDHVMSEEMNATKTALAAAETRVAELEAENNRLIALVEGLK